MIKKIISTLLIAGILLNFIGCSIRFEVDHKNNNAYTEELSNINKSISYNNETNIDIKLNYGTINISGYDGSDILVTGKSAGGENKLKLDSDNNKITIKDLNTGTYNLNLFGNNRLTSGPNYDIKIPYAFTGDLYFCYGAGDTSISNITCTNINIEGGAANLEIDNIVFQKFDLTAGVGESSIYLKEKCGEININGGVGSVNLDISEVGGNLTFDGGVGDAKIKIPENSPVYFETDSGVGSTKLNAKTSGENLYRFELNIGVGDIKVYN